MRATYDPNHPGRIPPQSIIISCMPTIPRVVGLSGRSADHPLPPDDDSLREFARRAGTDHVTLLRLLPLTIRCYSLFFSLSHRPGTTMPTQQERDDTWLYIRLATIVLVVVGISIWWCCCCGN